MYIGIGYRYRQIWKILYRYFIGIGRYENWIYRWLSVSADMEKTISFVHWLNVMRNSNISCLKLWYHHTIITASHYWGLKFLKFINGNIIYEMQCSIYFPRSNIFYTMIKTLVFSYIYSCKNSYFFTKGEQKNFFFQINSKTLFLRIFFLNLIFSTKFPLINYRGIKGSLKNHILKNATCFS